MQYCLTKGCPGKLVPCFVEGAEQAYECPGCGAVYEINEDLGRKARRFDLAAATVHRVTLAEVIREPGLVALGEWEHDPEVPDPALAGFHEVHVTSYNNLSRRLPRRPMKQAIPPDWLQNRVDPEYEEEEVPLAEQDFDPPVIENPRAWMRP